LVILALQVGRGVVPKWELVWAKTLVECLLRTWRGKAQLDEAQVLEKVLCVVGHCVDLLEDVGGAVELNVCVQTDQVNEEIVGDDGLGLE